MKTENIIQTKSYAFAVRIVKTYQFLGQEKKEYVVSKQLLRCGTSIGANIEEALGGQSQKDFFAKLSIAYKEARESHYWIRLLKDTGYLTAIQHESLLKDAEELLKIIGSIQKTIRNNTQPNKNNTTNS
ncbi:four helix bundle protein [Flavobacterium microcysteis]|uniref:Four helix bundle protein n=1 Tax=Flavobacterium microcysteis TaxID=2596891 RepID=A0A501QDV6_9FLAO|nr:four helix bundle protein [Flavobacterium microcysteis]TPD70554.1 four helix bundle protein [Flavobacterium microcysteis]